LLKNSNSIKSFCIRQANRRFCGNAYFQQNQYVR